MFKLIAVFMQQTIEPYETLGKNNKKLESNEVKFLPLRIRTTRSPAKLVVSVENLETSLCLFLSSQAAVVLPKE